MTSGSFMAMAENIDVSPSTPYVPFAVRMPAASRLLVGWHDPGDSGAEALAVGGLDWAPRGAGAHATRQAVRNNAALMSSLQLLAPVGSLEEAQVRARQHGWATAPAKRCARLWSSFVQRTARMRRGRAPSGLSRDSVPGCSFRPHVRPRSRWAMPSRGSEATE